MKTPVCSPTSSAHFASARTSPSVRLVRLAPSLILLGVTLLLHITALLCLLMSSIPMGVVYVSILLLCLSLLHLLYQYWSMPLLSLHYTDGDWQLMPESHQLSHLPSSHQGNKTWGRDLFSRSSFDHNYFNLVGWAYCSRFFIILRVQSAEGRLRYLPVAFDSCRQDEFRWLKVIIKYFI